MKRGISFFLACLFMVTTSLTLFSGCGKDTTKMLVSEWLYLVNNAFGFSSYTQEEPYIESITADNPYYDVVQVAFEYSVLPEGYTALNLDEELTREVCALTLAGAIYHKDDNSLEIADSSKLMFPESVTTVVNKGVMSLDSKGRFNPADEVPYDEAVAYIDKAYNVWVNHKFENKIEYELQDAVVDLNGVSANVIHEDGTISNDNQYADEQYQWLETNNYTYDGVSGTVSLDNISEKNIEEGSILALPATLEKPTGFFCKVTSITEENGRYILTTEEPDMKEIWGENAIFQGTDTVDFSKAIVYDGDGNLISTGALDPNQYIAAPMSYTNMASTDGSVSFAVDLGDGVKCSIKIPSDGSKVSVGISNTLHENKDKNTKTELEFGADISNLEIIRQYNSGTWLHPYKDMSFNLGLQYDVTYKGKFTTSREWEDDLGKRIPKTVQFTESAIAALCNTCTPGGWQSKKTLAKLNIPIDCANSIELKVIGKFSLEGGFEVAFAFADAGTGVEKRKGSGGLPVAYFDKGRSTSSSITGEIEAEATVGLNVAWAILGADVVDAEGGLGLKGKISAALNAVDNERFPRITVGNTAPGAITNLMSNAEIMKNFIVEDLENAEFIGCFELDIKPIFYLEGVTDGTVVGKAIRLFNRDFKFKYTREFTSILYAHAEVDSTGWHFTECTLSERIDDGIERGSEIKLSPQKDYELLVGESVELKFDMFPEDNMKYYTFEDLVVESNDVKIAAVAADYSYIDRKNGVGGHIVNAIKNIFGLNKKTNESKNDDYAKLTITGVSEGETKIVVRTRDNKYSTDIKVKVKEKDAPDVSSLRLDSFAKTITLGGSGSVAIQSVPEGESELTVFWESDNPSVARVNSVTGEIYGVSEGTATVSAYISGMENTAVYCLITVTDTSEAAVTLSDGLEIPKQWIKIDGLPVIIIEEI